MFRMRKDIILLGMLYTYDTYVVIVPKPFITDNFSSVAKTIKKRCFFTHSLHYKILKKNVLYTIKIKDNKITNKVIRLEYYIITKI